MYDVKEYIKKSEKELMPLLQQREDAKKKLSDLKEHNA